MAAARRTRRTDSARRACRARSRAAPGRGVAERVSARHEIVEIVHRHLVVCADRHDLLRETSSGFRGIRVSSIAPSRIASRDDRDSRRSARNLGKILPFETECSSWPARPTRCRPAGDRLRALDLDHEVDGAHVDPELERRGRDEAGDPPRLQELLDDDPLLAGERAVVRAGELFARELVDAEREPLREPPVVDEDDRRAVRADELEDRRVDRRPDRAARLLDADAHLDPVRERGHGEPRRRRQLAHVLDGDDDLEVELLAHARSTSSISRPVPATKRPISSSGRCVAESPMRWKGRSTSRSSRSSESARWAPRFVPATACTSSRITVSIPRRFSRACEVSSRNSDSGVVMRTSGRRPEHAAALVRRRVAGAHPDRELRAEAGQRKAEVPLDVVVERLERRHVEEAKPRAGRLVQPVDPDEERGQRLPRARRRLHEHVAALRDRGPAECLRGSRPGERPLEPLPRPGREGVERLHRGA